MGCCKKTPTFFEWNQLDPERNLFLWKTENDHRVEAITLTPVLKKKYILKKNTIYKKVSDQLFFDCLNDMTCLNFTEEWNISPQNCVLFVL